MEIVLEITSAQVNAFILGAGAVLIFEGILAVVFALGAKSIKSVGPLKNCGEQYA